MSDAANAELDAELVHVTKVYEGGITGVDDVSLQVRRGEFFSLLGPSGCGKSTTLRLIAGLERSTSGEVRIRGEVMGDRPPHRRPTNMVFQQLALFPHLDVAENIAFGLRLKGLPRPEIAGRVRDALALVGLSGYERRRIAHLSGGQQQRVAIARALVNQPAVLLLDEPLGALDLRLRLRMQEALKDIQRKSSTTFVYVTHDQGEALTMSDRIAVMNRGKIEQVGTPKQIYESPRTRFAAEFVGDTNLLDGVSADDGWFRADGLSFRVAGPGTSISLRPEQIRIGAQLQGLPNIFDGLLEEITYLGSVVRYRVRLSQARVLIVQGQNTGATEALVPGTKVQVGWPVEAAVVLPPGA